MIRDLLRKIFSPIKKLWLMIWRFIKSFPVSCYGLLSLITYRIFSYDFFIIGLIPGYPFVWIVGSLTKLLFPEDFLNSLKMAQSATDLIIVYFVAAIISIPLDLLISFIRKSHLKKS